MLPKMSNAISLRKDPIMPSPRTFSLKYPGWFEKRQDVRRKLDRINNGIWESEEEQIDYLRTVFGAVGEDLYFLEPVSFVNGKNIFIGDHVFINSNVTFIDAAPIEIGDHTMIAPSSRANAAGSRAARRRSRSAATFGSAPTARSSPA